MSIFILKGHGYLYPLIKLYGEELYKALDVLFGIFMNIKVALVCSALNQPFCFPRLSSCFKVLHAGPKVPFGDQFQRTT